MKPIAFEKNNQHVQVSSEQVETHKWKGFNSSDKPIKVTQMGVSCGCFSFERIEEVPAQSDFEITTYINKVGKSGLFSVSLTIDFENGQKEELRLSGKII